jgi:hypothetical protein
MSERGLTFKQTRFAELVASGCSKVEAFRQAYPSDRRGRGTASEGAKRVARLPKVQAEVQRLSLLRSPYDATAQAQHIVARLLDLSKDPDPAIALRAIAQWGKLAEAGLLKPPGIDDTERDRLVDELVGLYERASAVRVQNETVLLAPGIPKSEEESDGQVVDVEIADTELSEAVPLPVVEELPSQSLPPWVAHHKTAEGLDQPECTQQHTATTPEYEWVNLPGHFGKARRRRVRIS